MKRSNKKGFTIVELVIVIAVIAILAAVLIPTIAGLVKKANISADQQAVRQMNQILASNEAPENPDEVIALLIANKYSGDLTTYYSGYNVAWIKSDNCIVLVEDGKIAYPAQYEGKDATIATALATIVEDVDDFLAALAGGGSVYVKETITTKTGDDLAFNEAGTVAIIKLNGNKIVADAANTDRGYKDGVVADKGANVTISGGTIEGTDEVEQVVAVYGSSSLAIENSTISGGTNIAVLAEAGGTAEISDSVIYGVGINPVQAYGGTLTLTNVTVMQNGETDGEDYYNAAILVASDFTNKTIAEVKVDGGNYSGKYGIFIVAPGGNVTISDGVFTGTEAAIHSDFTQSYKDKGYECTITITGGTFIGDIEVTGATTLVIKGGTFTTFDPTAYVADGYKVVESENGYTVVAE